MACRIDFRSDNGSPFASAGITGLTPLSVRFIKLGIALERIAPGKPQQNGRHERFHRTMLPLTEAPQAGKNGTGPGLRCLPPPATMKSVRMRRSPWTPQRQHYRRSQRVMPRSLPEPEYPAEAAVRRVRHNGEIRMEWRLHLCLGDSLAGEAVAATETDEGDWALSFHAHPLGILDTRRMRARPPQRRANQTSLALRRTTSGGKTATYVSGSICHPSIGWTISTSWRSQVLEWQERGSCCSNRPFASCKIVRHTPSRFEAYFVVPEPDRPKPLSLEMLVARYIAHRSRMLSSIHFEDQAAPRSRTKSRM